MSDVPPPFQLATGDSAVGNLRRYSFVAFDDPWITQAIFGFFIDLVTEGAWFQVGTATPFEAAQYFANSYASLGVDLATIGAIVPYAGGILPSGWLVCDGSSLLRADYPQLFAAIGTVWGAADGTHFNIPDLRGKTLVGQGTNPGTGTTFALGSSAGEETHTLVTGEVPSHTHTDSGHTHAEGTAAPTAVTVGAGAPAPSAVPAVGVTGSGTANLDSSGGDGAHNNMQPYAVVNFAIIAF